MGGHDFCKLIVVVVKVRRLKEYLAIFHCYQVRVKFTLLLAEQEWVQKVRWPAACDQRFGDKWSLGGVRRPTEAIDCRAYAVRRDILVMGVDCFSSWLEEEEGQQDILMILLLIIILF